MPVRINGLQALLKAARQTGEGIREAVTGEMGIGSMEPYAFGQETGTHRRGKLARRGGGAWYMRSAMQQARPEIAPTLGKALSGGVPAVRQAKKTLAERFVALARPLTPFKIGILRDSLTPIYPGGPSPAAFTRPNARGYRGATRATRSFAGRGPGGGGLR